MNKELIDQVAKSIEVLRNVESRDEIIRIIRKVVEGFDRVMEERYIHYAEIIATDIVKERNNLKNS